MSLSRVAGKIVGWRWTPTVSLISAAVAYALLVGHVIPRTVLAPARSAGHATVGAHTTEAELQRPETPDPMQRTEQRPAKPEPETPALSRNVAVSRPPVATQERSAPPRRRGFSPVIRPDSSDPEDAAQVVMVPPPPLEPPPVPDPPALPPSVELAELVALGVAEPGQVEFADDIEPVSGQVREPLVEVTE